MWLVLWEQTLVWMKPRRLRTACGCKLLPGVAGSFSQTQVRKATQGRAALPNFSLTKYPAGQKGAPAIHSVNTYQVPSMFYLPFWALETGRRQITQTDSLPTGA